MLDGIRMGGLDPACEQVEEADKRRVPALSRRRFVGLTLGAVGSLLAACGRGTQGPSATSGLLAGVQTATTEVPPTPTALPATATDTPTVTAVPPTATRTPTATAGAVTTAEVAPSPTAAPPTYTPVPATPTNPPPPTATPLPLPSRAALMAHWPETSTSRVVVVRHSGVWTDGTPDPEIVLEMLDAGVRALADIGEALAVWRVLFHPEEQVLLKVNCIAYGGPTQPAVTYAVARRLQDAGLAAEKILIFDRTDHELEAAGYLLNDGGPGVQCHGTRGKGTEAALSQAEVRFFQEIDACDAIINVPIPKQHGTAGLSVALKNHYGSVDRPGRLHGNSCDPAIAELNAQPTIRDKTRLVVGAALNVSPLDWNRPEREDALLLATDPVALDTVARDILVRHRQAQGLNVRSLIDGAPQLATAQALQVGATEAGLIDLREVVLG